MKRLLAAAAIALGLALSLAACDPPGHQASNDYQQVGSGLNK